MKKIIDIITQELEEAFMSSNYDKQYAKATISNRPDLCEYQCNGALVAAKVYKKPPIVIASEIAERLKESQYVESVEAVNPGFINIRLHVVFIADFLNEMSGDSMFGVEKVAQPKKIIVDYGGANVAKPLHVGHLRTAVIGESIKRIATFLGHDVIGDVHLGDWGLQMGLVITELKKRKPQLVYFQSDFSGSYPEEAPFTIGELEEIYPTASGKAKQDPSYKEEALQATVLLQQGHVGYHAIWKQIIAVSVSDLKKNYDRLGVTFDLWNGESDAQPYIPEMLEYLKKNGYAHIDEGALVIDVKEETDTKEIPPCMILKSDGAALYGTTDLATLVEREEKYKPDEVIYVVDKRQELHFVQVFRSAKKTKIVGEDIKLTFLGFGTMNGTDGKPFKTRDGGIMRLETFIDDINEKMYQKIMENAPTSEVEARKTANMVGLAAIKYGDLSNQASKDYIFDTARFTSFEGNTGPYILYTMVRMKSILSKYIAKGKEVNLQGINRAATNHEKTLMLEVAKFNQVIEDVHKESAPHRLCAYVYDIANAFNGFYHGTKILTEENVERQISYIALLDLTKKVLEACIWMLGFEAPEKM